MKVIYLAAGAGGMICGSCLRDNRLAATLIEKGKNVSVLPLYTPLKVDEPDTAPGPVYFGGINVFLQQAFGLFRRTPRWVDAVLDGRGLLRSVGRLSSGADPTTLGPMTNSMLRGTHGNQRKELDRLIRILLAESPHVINLANLMFIGVAEELKRHTGAKIICTLSGEDIFLDQLPDRHRTEALDLIVRAADHVDAFISTSRYYADHCAGYFKLPADRIHHVPMGIRAVDFARTALRVRGDDLTIGYFARICREKGFVRICEAFVELNRRGHACRLLAGGYLGKLDRPAFDEGRRLIAKANLSDRFNCVGEVDRDAKVAFYHSIDLFSVPAIYREAKGLSVLEAMAAGVPVVQPRHGSYPELIESTGGGLLFEPGSLNGLVEALEKLMHDDSLRASLGQAGQSAVAQRFNDHVMADTTWRIYEQLFESPRAQVIGSHATG